MTPSFKLAVLIAVFLSCIEACSYNSDCCNGYAGTSNFQCCNGQCIDNQAQCHSILPIVSAAFLSGGVVIICIIACCCCYPFCPCFRRYSPSSTRAIIIEGEPLYQHFILDPTETDVIEPSTGPFYPQFVALLHPIQQYSRGYPMQQQAIPNSPYSLRQPEYQGWYTATDAGRDA